MKYPFKFANRLSNVDIKKTFRHGKRLFLDKVVIVVNKNNKKISRLAVVSLKKELKRSVDRNYQKRIVRNWFRHNQQNLKGLDLIFLLKKDFFIGLQDPKGEKIVKFAKNVVTSN